MIVSARRKYNRESPVERSSSSVGDYEASKMKKRKGSILLKRIG